jgi:hypothetical protein
MQLKKTWVSIFKKIFFLLLIPLVILIVLFVLNYFFPFLHEGLELSNKKVFITFGATGKSDYNQNSNYKEAVNRIIKQASSLELFDTIKGYNEEDLKKDNEFWNKHSDFILSNTRGYGYWIWKPYLIMKTLETMNNNDILLYSDSGCEIDIRKKDKMVKLLEDVKNDLLIASYSAYPEKKYNKMDTVLYLDMKTNSVMDSLQHAGTTICILKCEKTLRFVKEWYETCCQYHLIDDSPSNIQNDDSFVEHRHDQSIFSLLTKKPEYDFQNMSITEAIDIVWNRTGKSVL